MRTTIFLLLLTFSQLASAQCNYENLIKEGKAFYEKQQYRSALKKFNAARTCDPTRSIEVDQHIDKVFDAIEDQRDEAKNARNKTEIERERAEEERKKAERAFQLAEEERKKVEIEKNKALEALRLAAVMRDSARQAKMAEQRLLLLNESGELRQLGYSKFIEKNYERALYFFEKAQDLLENAEIRDTVVAIRMEVLQEKIDQTKAILKTQAQFQKLMAEGDTVLNVLAYTLDYRHAATIRQVDTAFNSGKLLSRAYKAYIAAKHLHFDSIEAQDRLYRLERIINTRAFPKRFLDAPTFYEVMLVSAEMNLQLDQPEIAQKRVRHAVKHGFTDLNLIGETEIKTYAERRVRFKRLLNRFSLYTGVKQFYRTYYNYEDDPGKERSFSMLQAGLEGTVYKSFGLGLSFAGIPKQIAKNWNIEPNDANNPAYVRQREFAAYAFWNVFPRKTWWRKKALFQLTPKAGYAFGKNWTTADSYGHYFSYSPARSSTLFDVTYNSPDIEGVFTSKYNGETVRYHKYSYSYVDGTQYTSVYFNWNNTDRDPYHNLLLGLRLALCPFARSGLTLYLEPMWNFAVGRKERILELDKFDLIDDFYTTIGHSLSENERYDILNNYFYYSDNEYYRYPDPEFNKGFSLGFGLSYQF